METMEEPSAFIAKRIMAIKRDKAPKPRKLLGFETIFISSLYVFFSSINFEWF
jgi:hypothetical protein